MYSYSTYLQTNNLVWSHAKDNSKICYGTKRTWHFLCLFTFGVHLGELDV